MRFVLLVLLFCSIRLTMSKDAVKSYHGKVELVDVNAMTTEFHPRLLKDSNRRYTRQDENVQNITTVISDQHLYYQSHFYPPGEKASSLWFDLTKEVDAEEVHLSVLSDTFGKFEVHLLPFSFRYYGHMIDRVAVSTSGFINTGDFRHPYIAATQFIAPLMANFNPSIGAESTAHVLVYSTDDRFTVQWDKVVHNEHDDDGPFTFQVSLFPDGSINLAYREIPLLISRINDRSFPVEVGLSDGLFLDTWRYNALYDGLIHVRELYEHDRISLTASDNLTMTAYVLEPLPNCVTAKTCEECAEISNTTEFECGWCEPLQRCSDGFDRNFQDWFENGCQITAVTKCIPTSKSPVPPLPTPTAVAQPQEQPLTAGAVVGISVAVTLAVLLVAIVLLVTVVLIYGYRHPNSKLGLFMIEHRPGAASLNQPETDSHNGNGSALKFDNEEH